jgi:predicted NAD/FAD-dependent oxidoreductase
MFAAGTAALPAAGMAAIPRQLAERLPAGTVQLEKTVETIEGTCVTTTDGQRYQAENLVIATEASAAARLLGAPELDCGWQATHAFSFAAPVAPCDEPILMLDGTGRGPINHLAVVSQVAPSYAPEGRALISANVVGACEDPPELLPAVRTQLREWFGGAAERWDFLQVASVPFALPEQTVERLEPVCKGVQAAAGDHVWICGDHRETSSIQGALQSGLRVAEQLLGGALSR